MPSKNVSLVQQTLERVKYFNTMVTGVTDKLVLLGFYCVKPNRVSRISNIKDVLY